jgi:two-component system, cell cycle sensor histidine kinase and response regulator CckA
MRSSRTVQDGGDPMQNTMRKMNAFPRWVKAFIGLMTLSLLAYSVWFYRVQEQNLRYAAENQLQAIAKLKVNEIVNWRANRLSEAYLIMESPFLTEGIAAWMADPQAKGTEKILTRFRSIQNHYVYTDVILVDTGGKEIISLNGRAGCTLLEKAAMAEAFRKHCPVLTDLHEGPGDLPPHVSVIVPLFLMNGESYHLTGAVILQSDARHFLYPMIQSWPIPSKSAETLLVRRDGDSVLFLNELRHQTDTALKFRIPLSEKDVVGVMAVLGKKGLVQGKDYRGVDVISFLAPIPDSSWFISAKMDKKEAFSFLSLFTSLILILALGFTATVAAIAYAILQKNTKSHYMALLESEQRYQNLFTGSRDGIVVVDDQGRFLDANAAYCAMLGYSIEELRAMNGFASITPEKWQVWEHEEIWSRRLLQDGYSSIYEKEYIRKDGTVFPVELQSYTVFDPSGKIRYLWGVARDITERKKAEATLQAASLYSYTRSLIETSLDPFVTISPEGKITDVNKASEKITGLSRERLIGTNFEDYFTEPEMARNGYQKVFEQGQVIDYPLSIRHTSGAVSDVLYNASVYRNEKGEVLGVFAAARDITKRKQIEEALRESQERYRNVVEGTTDLITRVDAEGSYLFVNHSSLKIHGLAPEDCIGRKAFDFIHPEDRETTMAAFETWKKSSENVLTYENRLVGADGRVHHMSWAIHPEHDAGGNVTGFTSSARDITERKLAEETRKILEKEIQQVKKIEALSRMAGAIAHHFNNQLLVVTGNLELALSDLPHDALPRKNLNQALKAALRSSEISGLMLTYLGQKMVNLEPVDLSEACRRNMTMLQAVKPSSIDLNVDFMSPGPVIQANNSQMQQLLTHLITNAWESIGDASGRVTLMTRTFPASDIPNSQISPIDWKPATDILACLEVTDSGCGISEEEMDRLFDPFFTTKFTGRGLGLSVVLGIVKTWAGAISVKSEKGHGSTFRVYFPIVTSDLIPRRAEKPAAVGKNAEGSTVLLVDDHDDVRKMAADMLKHLGFTVLTAADGLEAIELFREHRDIICFVLTDLTMPGMDGWQTLSALRKIDPHIPVILSSGYDEAYVMGSNDSVQPHIFLHKPYSMSALKKSLDQVFRNDSQK